jgi:predicted metalloendopeptidase
MTKNTRKNKNIHKEIKKNKSRKQLIQVIPKMNSEQKKLVCSQYFDKYESFEDKKDQYKKYLTSKKYNLDKVIIKEFKKAVSPSNITPQNDYYSYINERWLKAASLEEHQKYIVQIDDFRLVQDKVYLELIEIVKDYIKNTNTEKSKQLNNFYKSLLELNTIEQTKKYALNYLNEIDELRKDKSNLWKMLGMLNKNEIVSWGSPISWSLNPDDKQPDIFRCYINSPQLSLIDINVYFDDNTDVSYKAKYRREYLKYINNLFDYTLGKNHGLKAKDIFDCENKILNAMGCFSIKENKKYPNYNKVTASEAKSKYKFDWEQLSKEIGFKETPSFFITSNLNYLKCASEMLLNEWDSEVWRTYWIYLYVRQILRWNAKHRRDVWKFIGEFVRGQDKDVEDYLYPVYGLGYAFNTLLTNEYIDRYENQASLNYVKSMSDDLKAVFIRIIKRNNWLQPITKKYALEKLNKFNIEVGSPKILREDPVLDYDINDAWGNLVKISKWRSSQAVKLDGKKVIDIPVIDWAQTPPKFISTQAYVVNASYTPSKNGIYVPLGYIQKPFVDLDERGIEYNLAHIGFTLGHEMSHALDDWGSQYDATGKLNDWWTEKDKRVFKRIQKDVIKQYEEYAKRDGIIFDAEPSIGEDLADISGLAICLEYLRDFQIKNDDILPIKSISIEAFFIYFAFQMRQKVSKKALIAQLKTNPHPLDKYRTNVPLSRSPVFRALYNIIKGDGMWWHSTNRVWQS